MLHGDCRDVLATLDAASVDAVVTDPPYGTDAPRDGYGRRKLGGRRIDGDADLTTFAAALPEIRRVLKRGAWLVAFCSPKRHAAAARACEDAGLPVLHEVVWDKLQMGLGGGIRYQHENVLLCADGPARGWSSLPSVLRVASLRGRARMAHPHQKPVPLMASLVGYACPVGGLVVDPFAGSGSTGVACVQSGRRFIGVESKAEHADTARQRIADAAAQLPLEGVA